MRICHDYNGTMLARCGVAHFENTRAKGFIYFCLKSWIILLYRITVQISNISVNWVNEDPCSPDVELPTSRILVPNVTYISAKIQEPLFCAGYGCQLQIWVLVGLKWYTTIPMTTYSHVAELPTSRSPIPNAAKISVQVQQSLFCAGYTFPIPH